MHILFSIADPDSPFLRWFAECAKGDENIQLSFLCLYNDTYYMKERMALIGMEDRVHWIEYHEEKRKTDMFRVIPKIYSLIKQLKPDVVSTMLFDDTFAVLTAAKLAGVKHRVATKHDTMYHYHFFPQWIFFDRINNWLASKLIVVASPSKQFLIDVEKCPEEKIEVIHNGIKLEELTTVNPQFQKDFITKHQLEGKKIVGSVGRLEHNKGYHTIFEAAEAICKERNDVVFVWAGIGSLEEEFTQEIQNRGLQGKVILTGWIDEFNMASLMDLFDVLAHASLFETFGLVVLECMLNRVPVVVTKSTGLAVDALEHKKNGFLFDYEDVNTLKEGINYFLDNYNEALLIEARDEAMKRFNVKVMYQNYMNFYAKLVSSMD